MSKLNFSLSYLYNSLIFICMGTEQPFCSSSKARDIKSVFLPVLFLPAYPNNTCNSETRKLITICCKIYKVCFLSWKFEKQMEKKLKKEICNLNFFQYWFIDQHSRPLKQNIMKWVLFHKPPPQYKVLK